MFPCRQFVERETLISTPPPSPPARPRIAQATRAARQAARPSDRAPPLLRPLPRPARPGCGLSSAVRLSPKASQGLCAGLRGPMPCARRQRKERRRLRSRRCSGVSRACRLAMEADPMVGFAKPAAGSSSCNHNGRDASWSATTHYRKSFESSAPCAP
jgi:hypothetical protein